MSVALSPEFKFVTEECLKEWKNPSTSGSYRVPDPVPMTRFLFELCWAMIKGELPYQKCKIALDSVSFLKNEINGEDMGSILADIVAQFAQDLTIPGDQRSRLVKMTKSLVDASLIPVRLLQERCEEEFLFEAEFSRMKAQDLKSREVRVNTRLLYQQTKFNLLREESEGYAKLITLLCQDGLDSANNKSPIMTISIVKSLIGHFDLDPNRVFDIVLDCFELYPEKKIFYDLIPIFPKSHAAQILGFKFQYYQRMEVTDNVPSALFHIAALLVEENFIDLDSIYAHLLPKDEEAFKLYDAFLSKRIDEASKIGKINLAATGKDLMETEEKQDVTVDLYAALDTEIDALADRAPEIGTNQKLGLLIGFLSVHDWYHAHILFERLAHLNPVEHVPICEGLFRVIEKIMQGAYKTYCNYENAPRKFANPDSNAMEEKPPLVELSREFFQMLSVAGPYLHRDTKLLQKVCRVLRGYYTCTKDEKTSKELNELNKIKEIRVMDALSTCLLPSLQLIPANPAIGHEIWEVLSLLSYEVRYRLYGEWEKDDERNPTLLLARQIAKLDTRRILKRLAKENLKQLGRMVAKLAHANPMTVLRTIVQQIEAYRDMITPVVDAFKYLTQLEYDILEYVVIERLAQEGRDKLKEDGINLSDWLQSLASFWGHLCKKYPSMELRGLFQYLVNKLQQGSGIELVLLEELIEQMANVHYTENMTEEQLDALAGSETLRYQSNSVGTIRNNKVLNKSTNRLRDSLLSKDDETKLAIPLLMLIAQHRSTVVIKNDAPYIKMVSEQFDRAHGMLLQYVEFLSSAVSPVSSYAQLIPSLHDLLQKYHLEPEVAFLIYRPVMRLFKSASEEGIFWPLDGGEEGSLEESSDFVLSLDSSLKTIRWSDLLNTIGSTILANSSNSFSPDMFATFWGLTLYDLYVPKKRYEAELSKQHSALKALEDLSDTSSVAISKRKKDKEKIQELLDRLTSEYNKHEKHVASVRHRLIREKDKFFLSSDKATLEFLQRCVFPRCVFSATDAVYCAEFVATLHSVGTPGFNTYGYLDVLICKLIQPVICCCTELEAARFGRFLCETLKLAYHWKKSESTYERECGNMPGFVGNSRSPNSQRVSFPQFVRAHHRWSGRITRMLAQCLESNEYMEIRNALIVLTKISSVFPVLRKSGVTLEKRVAKIKADEREDLKVLATSVAAALASRKSTWVSDEVFCMGYVDLKPATTTSPKKSSLGNSNHQAVADSSNNIPSKENHAKRPKSSGEHKSEKLNGSASLLQDESQKVSPEENVSKPSKKPSSEPEARGQQKNRNTAGILGKPPQKDDAKLGKPPKLDDAKLGKPQKTDDAKLGKPSDIGIDPVSTNGTKSSHKSTSTTGTNLPKTESSKTSSEQTQKRAVQSEEQERVSKRRKGEERERENDNDERERERERDKGGEEREREREKDKREKEKDRERERSSERRGERDRSLEREGGKEERESEMLPPPPPLPPSFTPLTVSRHSVEREREKEREKERVREREREREDDVGKRRRERDDRDGSSTKVEERERERAKDDNDANASKRRKMKRSTSTEPGEYSPVIPSHSSHDNNNARGERKGGDNVRAHTKDSSTTPSKASRRETEQSHERDYEEDKRPRADTKRRHRK